jgi:hypothetical protein
VVPASCCTWPPNCTCQQSAGGWPTPAPRCTAKCIAHPHPLRREYFTTWRDAITAVTTTDPDTDSEHTFASEETRILAKWERLPVDLNPRWRDLRPGSRASSVRVVLTASIWPDGPDEVRAALADLPGHLPMRVVTAEEPGSDYVPDALDSAFVTGRSGSSPPTSRCWPGSTTRRG